MLTSASVIPNLFLVTFSDLRTVCSTLFLRFSNDFSGLTSTLHGCGVALWKNDKSGHNLLDKHTNNKMGILY